MNSTYFLPLFTCLICFFCINNHVDARKSQKSYFPVTKYGGVSDGRTDNSKAFASAWNDACLTPRGVLLVPRGTFVLSVANFKGPCNGKTYIRNMGIIRATPGGHYQDSWITFYDILGLRIFGKGIFDGYGESAWNLGNRPMTMRFSKVNNLIIKRITSLNSKHFHLHIVLCNNVLIKNVKIFAPDESPNTDGIHVARSRGVRIINSIIATGDDCISMGDGCEDMHVESVQCGPGHGMSIGSLGRYQDETDVKGVTIKNCNLTNTQNGLRIKTFAPSSVSSVVKNVTFENINLWNVRNPIIFDQRYCPTRGCAHQEESRILIDGVKFKNVKGTSASTTAVKLRCSKSHPCRNLEFEGIRITTAGGQSTTAVCVSANYKFVSPNQVPWTCGAPPGGDEDKAFYS